MEFEEVDIQAVRFLTSEGGTLVSTLSPDISCRVPEGALQTIGKKGFCRVSIQVMNTDPSIVYNHMGSDAFVSAIVVIEPVRRKFHQALTKTMPLPGFKLKKMDRKSIRILFSITGSGENSEWKDITSVKETAITQAIETGKISIDHVVTGRYASFVRFAVVCCENSIMDVPETLTEMMRNCMNGGACAACNDQPHLDLLHAARTGDLSALTACLTSVGMDINYANKGGQTALHLACKEGHTVAVQELLTYNPHLNILSKKGNAAIHLACFYGHLDIVDILLDAGCDVNLASRDHGFPPLYPAILETHCDIVQLLLSRGAGVTWTSPDGLSLLLVAVYSTFDKERTTALLHLLLEEVDLSQFLLSPQLKEKGFLCHGEALLHSVSTRQAAKDMVGAVRLKLANHSRDVLQEEMKSCEDSEGDMQCLLEAVRQGNEEKVAVLVQNKHLVNKLTQKSVNCLHCACLNDHVSVVERLIKAGTDVNHQTQAGFTCLYIAAAGGYTDVVKKLLKAGAYTDNLNEFGLSASDIATEMGFLQIVAIIKDYMIRNEYHKENSNTDHKIGNGTSGKSSEKDEQTVKKCCVVL